MNPIKVAQIILKDPERKSITRMMRESFGLLWRDKSIPFHYLSRYLYRKGYDYLDFLTTPEVFLLYSEKIHNPTVVSTLTNKIIFAEFCKFFNLPTPKLIGYNLGRYFFLDGRMQKINSLNDLEFYFRNLLAIHQIKSLIIKNSHGIGGASIYRIRLEAIKEDVEEIGSTIFTSDFVFQEMLTNHNSIAEIYPHSLNSIRVDMCLDLNDSPVLLGSVMRFGIGGKFMDNRSEGGFCVSMDSENGILQKYGFSQMNKGGHRYIKHPDTNFVFEGFQIPFYDQVIQLAYKLSNIFPTAIVGWDIAITTNGPVVIEGNHDSNVTMSEVGNGGYRKNPHIKRLLEKARG